MALKVAIVGLPNVGKSTLFNALTETAAAQAANYPFCTIEPNVGDVAVPEPRLDVLAKIAASKEIIPARINFVDVAGLVRGASKGEGLGNQFLSHIRDCDAVAFVARCFADDEAEPDVEFHPYRREKADEQVARLGKVRATRDAAKVAQTLDALTRAAREGRNVMPAAMDAVKAYASVGEVCGALKTVFGTYKEPVRF